MRIYIPTLGRHSAAEIAKGPLSQLPAGRVTYVVPYNQKERYASILPPNIDVLALKTVGIAQTRYAIGMNAHLRQEKTFMMADDDVRFLCRKTAAHWALREADDVDCKIMLACVEEMLLSYGHVGISAREGQNRLGDVADGMTVSENTRTLRVLAYRTEDFLSVEHGRVDVMEDFDVNLQLLRKGIPNANTIFWAQGQGMTNAPGGCSTYRSHEVHEASAKKLAELHPGIVRLRQKKNKTDASGFGTRTEVTIQWKKAFAESQK